MEKLKSRDSRVAVGKRLLARSRLKLWAEISANQWWTSCPEKRIAEGRPAASLVGFAMEVGCTGGVKTSCRGGVVVDGVVGYLRKVPLKNPKT